MDNNNSNAFLSNDDWIADGAFLDSFLSMETEDLLNPSSFSAQPDLIDKMLNFCDPPMYNEDDQPFKTEPMFSSGASDSGLSSDNLDLDINNDLDLLNSCLPSPASDEQETKPVQPLKRSVRNSNKKFGSATLRNNNNKKADKNLLQVKTNNGKSRSIIVPVSSQNNNKDFHSIKIVNSGSVNLKSANIKAVAANLLQKSKQGLLQKNILIPMQDEEDEDDDEMLNFDEIMQETDNVLAAHDDSDDMSSAESCSSGYPKLVLTNEEKRLLSKEGITLPTSYPLTKHEERELKRIRRKIRNKISAQDSRKRKKEYIDGLEERVKQCSDENQHLMKRIKMLQNQNQDLMSKMKKLQTLLTKSTGKTAQPATCLMILLLSMALVAVPNLKLGKDTGSELQTVFGDQQNRRNLLFDLKSELDDMDLGIDDYIPNEHDYVENVYKYVSQLSTADPPSPPPAKRAKMLIDYDIDSIDEWELKQRAGDGHEETRDPEKPKITVSKDLFEIGRKNETRRELSDADRILAQSIINLASAAALQKSSTA